MLKKYFFSFKNLFGLIISAICIYWSFKNFNFNEFLKYFKSIDYYFFIIAISALIFSVILRSMRWLLFFKKDEIKYLNLLDLFKNEMIGYFGNNIFPFKLGDLLRVFTMSRQTNISKTYLLGTVAIERIIDIASLIIFVCISLALFILITGFYPIYTLISSIATLFIGDFFNLNYLLYYLVGLLLMFGAIFLIIKNNKNLFNWKLFLSPFKNIKSNKKILKVIILSLFIWMIYLFNINLISYSCGYNFSILDSLLLLTLTTIVMIIPSAPGMIGTFHASIIIIMTKLLNYPFQEASSFSIILHAYSYITYSIIGGYFFMKSNVMFTHELKNRK